ncbi:MAG: hypothetical protein JWO13_806 [Acidobacteriales bacterium]|nr:hypothetical protein [Terriglobales bacterium]
MIVKQITNLEPASVFDGLKAEFERLERIRFNAEVHSNNIRAFCDRVKHANKPEELQSIIRDIDTAAKALYESARY